MRWLLALVAGSLALPAAARDDGAVLTVADVIARHEVLDGRIVRARGWMVLPCYRLGCALSAENRTDAPALSLGGSADFDRDLARAGASGREIVVEGLVKRDCFDHPEGDPGHVPDDITICADRADQLADPRLIEVIGKE